MKKILYILLIACFLISVTSCSIEKEHLNETKSTTEGVAALVTANNQFAFELYSQIDNTDEENIFFSPYSISTALAMTYEGARGSTAEEMQAVFHFPDDMRQNNAWIYNSINAIENEYQLNTANALWTSQNYVFLQEYLGIVENYYGGKAQSIDFNNAEKASEIINNWVEEQTNNKIKNLISPDQIIPLTKLVLTNAVYFKGKWKYPFEEDNTEDREFKTSTGQRIFDEESIILTVPMMYIKEDFKYAETDDVQILEMPYEGDNISMIIILPKILPKENIDSLELNAQTLNNYTDMLNRETVKVYIPKFTFKTRYSLNENLVNMGMPSAFSPINADFSGMTGSPDLFIGFVVHKAFIEVNEEGTEAAAATALGFDETTAMPSENIIYTFNADHPFLFIIKDKETGLILFMGKVNNPLE